MSSLGDPTIAIVPLLDIETDCPKLSLVSASEASNLASAVGDDQLTGLVLVSFIVIELEVVTIVPLVLPILIST